MQSTIVTLLIYGVKRISVAGSDFEIKHDVKRKCYCFSVPTPPGHHLLHTGITFSSLA